MEDDMLADFLADIEQFEETVKKGFLLIQEGNVLKGFDKILGALHTIKGTSGFMEETQYIAEYTHKLEDLLKAIQGGEVPQNDQLINSLIRGVEMVFTLLEQVRDANPLETANAEQTLAHIQSLSSPVSELPRDGSITIEEQNEIQIITLNLKRVVLSKHYEPLRTALNLSKGKSVLLSFKQVLTMCSSAWGIIAKASEQSPMSICGMSDACQITFDMLGLDGCISAFPDEENFWKSQAP